MYLNFQYIIGKFMPQIPVDGILHALECVYVRGSNNVQLHCYFNDGAFIPPLHLISMIWGIFDLGIV